MDWLSAGRPGRSTVAEVGRPDRSTDVHRTCTQPGLVGRSTGRSIVQRALLSVSSLDRPGRSTGGTTVRNLTVGADRPGGRPEGQICPFQLPTGRFLWGYKYPIFELVFNKFFKSKILILSSILLQVFKRVFRAKDFIFICFKGLEKSRKRRSL